MAIKGKDLIKMSRIEILEMLKQKQTKCASCGTPLNREDRHWTSSGDECSDCYYEALETK